MKKRLLGVLLTAAMVGTLLVGCGGSGGSTEDSDSGESGGDDSISVAYLCPSLDVPFWRYVKYGVENEMENLRPGAEVVTYDSKDDANTQTSNAQDAITKQVDAIIISPTDSASCVSVLSLAEEAGIPVVICDVGTDSGTYESFISTDNEGGAKELGEYVAEKLGSGSEVAQITLNQARINGVLRKDGFDAGIEAGGLEDVDFRQMEKVNREEGESYAQDLITAYPELKCIFCHSEDPSMGAISAIEAAGKSGEVQVVGFDCSPEVVEAIQDGRMLATAAQQPVLMGRTSSEQVDKILNGEEVEEEVVMETMLVTMDNIDEIYDTLIEVALTEE